MNNWLKNASNEELEIELNNNVYLACQLIEKLENAGRIIGNGHHIRQNIAKFAQDTLKSRWKDK